MDFEQLELDGFAEELEPEVDGVPQNDRPDLYKKWHRGGFMSIQPALSIGRVAIDIGAIDPNSKKFQGATKVWTPVVPLYTYLKAVYDFRAIDLYPENPKAGIPTDEGFAAYGGKVTDTGPVSRVLKIHYWNNDNSQAFAWKCGHFKARTTSTGAFIPEDMGSPLSAHMIQVTRTEMAQIYVRMGLALNAYAVKDDEWLKNLK